MYILNNRWVQVLGLVSVASVATSTVAAQPVELRRPPQEQKSNSLLDSTVRVRVINPSTLLTSTGTGVAVENGLILSAAHILGKGGEIEILVGNADSAESFDGKVEAVDYLLDLCLIRIVDSFEKKVSLPPVKILADFPVPTGSRVYAVGNPLGYTLTVSEGIVSACGVNYGEKFLLTDALIKNGNSGGPLVNHKGELIGLVLSVVEAQGTREEVGRSYGNVLPSIVIQEFLSDPKASREGWLGVSGRTVVTGFGNLAASEGFEVQKVLRPECGLQVGDILMMIEDNPIVSWRNLALAVRSKTPGTRLKSFVLRKGVFTELGLLVGSKKSY